MNISKGEPIAFLPNPSYKIMYFSSTNSLASNRTAIYEDEKTSALQPLDLTRKYKMTRVISIPKYLIHLSKRLRLSISLSTALESPTVLSTSKALRCALCTRQQLQSRKMVSRWFFYFIFFNSQHIKLFKTSTKTYIPIDNIL